MINPIHNINSSYYYRLLLLALGSVDVISFLSQQAGTNKIWKPKNGPSIRGDHRKQENQKIIYKSSISTNSRRTKQSGQCVVKIFNNTKIWIGKDKT